MTNSRIFSVIGRLQSEWMNLQKGNNDHWKTYKWMCSKYLSGSLDAEDGHPGLRVALELVHELDSLWGRDAAVDTDVTGLKEQRQEEEDSVHDGWQWWSGKPVEMPADGTPATRWSVSEVWIQKKAGKALTIAGWAQWICGFQIWMGSSFYHVPSLHQFSRKSVE